MAVCALIVAGGRGSRARQGSFSETPKQYALIGGQAVLTRTMRAFLTHPEIACVLVVIHKDDRDAYLAAIPKDTSINNERLLEPVFGGEDRQASVRAGLEALVSEGFETVLIHDGARPFVDANTISAVISRAGEFDGAVCAVAVADTLKRAGGDRMIVETVPRADLWRAQTPQGFRFEAILAAHRKAAEQRGVSFTDDAALAEWAGMKVAVVEGSEANEKLTTAEDLERADQKLRAQQNPLEGHLVETRVGTGFDVHRFGVGDHVWVCGVKIAHDKSLVGHSDADVGLHALTDALLGALGDGDIGSHFPPGDPKWKGARSRIFLEYAGERVAARGGRVVNVDVTLICETPKLGPHRTLMRDAVAAILNIDVSRVSVKATTTEKLGFTGRDEGMACMASVSVSVPVE